jgi:hypothetical protein
MNNSNAFIDNLEDDFKEKLPLTYRFVQSMNSARNQSIQSYTPAIVDMRFYESKSIEPSGFYRPISKIVLLVNHE